MQQPGDMGDLEAAGPVLAEEFLKNGQKVGGKV